MEVRDAFNNPVDSATVVATDNGTKNANFTGGNNRSTKTTDSEGKVTFEYTAPSSGDVNLTFNISGTNAGAADEWELVNKSYKIGSGSSGDTNSYLDVLLGPPEDMNAETKYQIVLVARDETHEPIANQDVTAAAFNASSGSLVGDFEETNNQTQTNADGLAVFNYTTPSSSVDQVEFKFNFSSTSEARKRVRFKRNITSSGSGTDDINPEGADTISLDSTSQNADSVTLTLSNTKGKTITFTKFRVSFFFQKNGNGPVTEISNSTTNTIYQSQNIAIPTGITAFDTNNIDVTEGNFQITFTFDNVNGGNVGFFIVTLEDSNGNRYTYFAGFN